MRFSPEEVERIRDLVRRGFSCIAIARELGRDALAIRHKCSAMGLRTRPRKLKDVHEVRIGGDVAALLKEAAAQRGLTVQRLANLILSAVALDKIINAVIDDDTERHSRLERAAVYRETYRKRRRNGEPILDPRAAALLGFKTALTRAGLLPPPKPLSAEIAAIKVEMRPLRALLELPQLIGVMEFAGDHPRSNAQGIEPGRPQ